MKSACCALLFAVVALAAPPDRTVILISLDGFPAYSFDDPRFSAPTLRKLAHEGVMAARMQPVDPTVTWPNHTSMVTGVPPAVHAVLYNGLAVRQAGSPKVNVEPYHDRDELVKATTVYDLAFRAGMTTAQVDWVAIQKAPTITWSFAEAPTPGGPIEKELIAQGVLTDKDVAEFPQTGITWRDEMWTRAAAHIIEKKKPHLLLFHLLTTDTVQHRHAPKTTAAYAALALADQRVAEIVRSVERSGRRDKTTFIIVSDHGFKTYNKQIRPNVLLGQKGLGGKVAIVPEGGTAMVYGDVTGVRELFTGVEGIEKVLDPAEYANLKPGERVPKLVLAAKSGYGFSAAATGDVVSEMKENAGGHGYLSSDPEMSAIFIASGAGIRSGVKLEKVRTIDVAPTIASLLGLQMKDVSGVVLKEALR